MIRILPFACLAALLLSFGQIQAQELSADEQALRATLADYMDGGTYGDTTRLIRAFHPSASMKSVDQRTGEYRDVPIRDFLERAKANAGKTAARQTRIVYIDMQGNAAQARVELEYPTFTFIDFFNLLKIDGQWKIVSKIFYRQEKKA